MKTTSNLKTHSALIYFFLLPLSFILVSCNTTEPPPDNGNGNGNDKPKPKITLTVDDTSPTEVWLNLTTENIPLPDTLTLIRNNDKVKTIELFDSSFIFYQESLRPSQSYTYTAIINDTVTSEATAATMDTTSHNFSYEVFEFGEHGNSGLRDVAIIDENNIWAVGAVYLNDSTGQSDTQPYNAVHWNGNEWKTDRIDFPSICGQEKLFPYPASSVFAFSDGQVWASSSGDKIAVLKNDIQQTQFCLPSEVAMSINEIWGLSSNDAYVVGVNGSIAHYNGTSWSKVESGTEMTLADVYGTNSNELYVSGVNSSTISGILLQGNSSGFTTLKNSGNINPSQLFDQLYGELASVWVDEKGTLYVGGNLLYWNRRGKWDYVNSLPENILDGIPPTNYRGFISSIRGSASNDYVIAGERNTIKHFNGISWKQIGMEYDPNNPIDWYTVRQKENMIVAVGTNNSKSILIILKR